MITRIVKMTFAAEKTADFIKIFEESKHLIRGFEGCRSVKLLRQTDPINTFFTYSCWNSESDLENYRKSETFKTVWNKTKILFSDKPMAWSTEDTEL
jgi:autoinducer 2-degrading protein